MASRQIKLAYVAWITVCIVWGTTYLAIRVALDSFPVLLLAGIRWMSAGVLMCGALAAMGRPLPPPRAWGAIALLAFLMNGLGNGFVVWAEQSVPSGLTAVVVALGPFWQIGVEALRRDGERLTLSRLTGMVIGFAGILVLVWPELTLGDGAGRAMLWGVLGLQVACAGWALGTSYTKRRSVGAVPIGVAALQMLFSGVGFLALATAAGEWPRLTLAPWPVAAMIYLILAGAIVAYTAYVYAVKYLPISTVSLYAYVNPVIAVVLGTLLLDEPFSLRVVAAAALVLAGIAVVRGVTPQFTRVDKAIGSNGPTWSRFPADRRADGSSTQVN
jgi:drug/metabolite transporter (DMT)-like permease